MAAEAYPLQWPDGWKREGGKEGSRFDTPGQKAHAFLLSEVNRMGGSGVVISTNVPLRSDGVMRMDREPVDPGVAVYFTRKGKQVVFACDRFDLVRDNILAIGKTIEALRGIERWGASEMLERTFQGFAALPAKAGAARPWREVLLFEGGQVTPEMIEARYWVLARQRHPDIDGGSHEAMAELNAAREAAMKEVTA